MNVAVIGGAGAVGSTVTYTLAVTVPNVEITLIDTATDAAEGHAIDIAHATNHLSHPIGDRIALSDAHASVRVVSGPSQEASITDCDCLVIAYNVARPDKAVGRGGRDVYFQHNAPVADDIGNWLEGRDPRPVVVVTNPVGRITRRIWKRSGWPRESFMGYSLSETARAADEIARLRDTEPYKVRCPTMGVHGEQVVPVFSKTTVSGRPVKFTDDERRRVLDYVRDVPYRVMELRDPDESSRWVSGRGVAAVVHSLTLGGTDEPICLSAPLDGEYGYDDVCLSVPLTLTSSGWDTIHTWELSDEERMQLDRGYEFLCKTQRQEE